MEYEYQIFRIVKEIGIDNFHPLWRFFKEIKGDPDEYMKNRIEQAYERKESDSIPLNSFLVVFETLEAAESLVSQFETSRKICEESNLRSEV